LVPAITKVIEKKIKDSAHDLDSFLYQIQLEAQRAAKEAANNPDQAQNIYSRYADAAKNKYLAGKQKTQETAANTKVNMAVTQHDSIFPDIKLPGGISTKATEYKELARKGDKWESPIFSLGSANQSSSIPSAGDVTRKPHDVTGGGVRGAQNLSESEKNVTNGTTSGIPTGKIATAGATSNTTNDIKTNGTTNGHTNGSAGFGSQVDKAFEEKSAPVNGNGNAHGTTLGASNPLISGSS